MSHPVIVVAGILVCCFGVGLAVHAFILKMTEQKPTPVTVYEDQPVVLPNKHKQHDWRNITEFSRRCAICAEVEIASTIPEGMEHYVRLMTTRRAKEHPVSEAMTYSESDPSGKGWKCPYCERMIPGYYNLPLSPFAIVNDYRCPYCCGLLAATDKGYSRRDEPKN